MEGCFAGTGRCLTTQALECPIHAWAKGATLGKVPNSLSPHHSASASGAPYSLMLWLRLMVHLFHGSAGSTLGPVQRGSWIQSQVSNMRGVELNTLSPHTRTSARTRCVGNCQKVILSPASGRSRRSWPLRPSLAGETKLGAFQTSGHVAWQESLRAEDNGKVSGHRFDEHRRILIKWPMIDEHPSRARYWPGIVSQHKRTRRFIQQPVFGEQRAAAPRFPILATNTSNKGAHASSETDSLSWRPWICWYSPLSGQALGGLFREGVKCEVERNS